MRLKGTAIEIERMRRRSKPPFQGNRIPDFLHVACDVRNDAIDIFSSFSLGTYML